MRIVGLVPFDACIQQSALGTSYPNHVSNNLVDMIPIIRQFREPSIYPSIPVDITAIVTGDDPQVEMRCSLTHMILQIEHKSVQIRSVIQISGS